MMGLSSKGLILRCLRGVFLLTLALQYCLFNREKDNSFDTSKNQYTVEICSAFYDGAALTL